MILRLPFPCHIRLRFELVVIFVTILLTCGLLLVFWYISNPTLHKDKEDVQYYQFLPDCTCWRPFLYPPHNRTKLSSTCSDEAAQYEPLQNVVSFTYFVDPTVPQDSLDYYNVGLEKNLKLVQKHYPNFTMRVYTNKSFFARKSDSNQFCNLLCSNRELHWCDIRATPSHGDLSLMDAKAWRYLPLGDPSVNIFLSRDLTALISNREMAAVNDWMNISSKNKRGLHVMRDHVSQKRKPFLGGLWGGNNILLGRQSSKMLQSQLITHSKPDNHHHMESLSSRNGKRKSFRPDLLTEYIYKKRQKDIVAYDSYLCQNWGYGILVRPFPVQRKAEGTDIVGLKILQNEKLLYETCPKQCRPTHGKNWEYC